MPHAVFNLGALAATTEATARQLVPGIAPGGSRVGQPTKPALLIRNAWIELIDLTPADSDDFNMGTWYLKLSQEPDMTPGLQLPIGQIGNAISDSATAAAHPQDFIYRDLFKAQGTVWAAQFVGVRLVEIGAVTIDSDVHIDYERIDVPWMDWFVMWDFLDNIVDNEREY